LRKKRSTQLLRECWSFLTKLMTCQNLQNKLLNITVLFIWYLLASLKKMSLAKHGELFFILESNSFSPLAILASVWKKCFPTLRSILLFILCNLVFVLSFMCISSLWGDSKSRNTLSLAEISVSVYLLHFNIYLLL
jgi:hypothetical protein